MSGAMSAASLGSQDSTGCRGSDCEAEAPVSCLTLLAWCLTGMGGWWSLFAITAELPYLVAELPEAERLGNLLAVCTQVGTVCPLVYKVVYREGHGRIATVVVFSQLLAIAMLGALAFFWNHTIGSHSVVLLVGTLIAAGVGCLSNVTHWAMAHQYPGGPTHAMSVGMTFCCIFASCLAASQLAGCDSAAPRFSPKVFFLVVAGLQALSLAAFAVCIRAHGAPGAASRSAAARGSWSTDGGSMGGSYPVPSLTASNTRSPAGSMRRHTSQGLSDDAKQSLNSNDPAGSDPAPSSLDPNSGFEGGCRSTSLGPTASEIVLGTLVARLTLGACFIVFAVTYTVPTLLPFMVAGYDSSTQKQQLLLGVMILQNVGDVFGRVATICLHSSSASLLGVWAFVLLSTFVSMMYLTIQHGSVSGDLGYHAAFWLYMSITGTFFFCRGLLVTALYVRMHTGIKRVDDLLSGNMAVAGQLGTFTAIAVTFVCVNIFGAFA